MKQSIRNKVTQMMIASLGESQPPWRIPWSLSEKPMVALNVGAPCNFHSGRRYTGINPLLLLDAAKHYGYESKHWGTDKAWTNNLGAVAVGHATHIVLFAFVPKRDKTGKIETNKAGKTITFPLLREFPLFNVAQVHPPSIDDLLDGRCGKGRVSVVKSLLKGDGARRHKTTKDELLRIAGKYAKGHKKDGARRRLALEIHYAIRTNIERLKSVVGREPDFAPAEEFIKATGAEIVRGTRPRFLRGRILMPPKVPFKTLAEYYDSLFHEICHWGEQRVGVVNEDYNFCELVAEIGACFLMLEIGVPMYSSNMMEQSKAYVKSWLHGMESDSRFIFEASRQASKVVDFLLSLNRPAIGQAA